MRTVRRTSERATSNHIPPYIRIPSLPPSLPLLPIELREYDHGLGVPHEVLGSPVRDGIQVGPGGVVA